MTLKHLLSHTPGFEDHVIGLFGRGHRRLGPLGELLAAPSRPGAQARRTGHLFQSWHRNCRLDGTRSQWHALGRLHRANNPAAVGHATHHGAAAGGGELPAEMSKGYSYSSGKYVRKAFEYVPPAPAGSMSASAGDMAKFLIMHLQNGTYEGQQILSEDMARQMHSLLFTHDPRIEGMAYGFMRMSYGDEQIVEHGGDTEAFHSFFVLVPERKFGFFVSYNTTTAGAARNTLLHALMDRYFPAAEKQLPSRRGIFPAGPSYTLASTAQSATPTRRWRRSARCSP